MGNGDSSSLSGRETTIIAVSASLVGLMGVAILLIVICLRIRRARRYRKRSQRVQYTLESLSFQDPLEVLVRQESRRNLTTAEITNSFSGVIIGQGQRFLYKIWNHSRTNKQFAFSESLEQLKEKACVKLALTAPVTVVLESDGTEVTSDEELWACAHCILLVLEKGQQWRRAMTAFSTEISRDDCGGVSNTKVPDSAARFMNGTRDCGLVLNPVTAFYDNMAAEMRELETSGSTDDENIRL